MAYKDIKAGTIANISLKLPKMHILNSFGMQPIFVNKGKIDESFVGFVYRQGTQHNQIGQMKQLHKWRLGEENNEILENAFHIKDADRNVIKLFLNERTFTFKQNGNLDSLMLPQNFSKLQEILLLHMKRIKYYTMMWKGNFLITSRQDLYYSKPFLIKDVKDYTPYLVSEDLLPRNVIILGHSNHSFFTPYVACPLFDKVIFDDLCSMNGIDVKQFEINPSKRYPLIEKQLNFYSLYQSYLDNVDVPYWYIETFRNPVKTRQKAYYTTLFFD